MITVISQNTFKTNADGTLVLTVQMVSDAALATLPANGADVPSLPSDCTFAPGSTLEIPSTGEKYAYDGLQWCAVNVFGSAAGSGAPTKVTLASQMTDPATNYLYLGSEEGYTAGHWYYNIGGSWLDGGVFGGTNIDDTLTQTGQAADAKATGDALALKWNIADTDSTPTDSSTDLVTSGGVKAALDLKWNIADTDNAPTANSTKLVKSGGVYSAIEDVKGDLSLIGAYPLTWEQGRFNASGDPITGTGRIRTVDYTAVTAGETFVVSVPDSTLVYFYAWNIDGSFNGYTTSALTNGGTYTVPDGVDKIKVVVGANRDFPDITSDYGANVSIYRTDSALIKTLSNPLKGYAGAMLTIIDDDCNLRFYTDLYPIVRERNVPVSTAVITGSVGDGTHMTWEQIQECSANGIEVLSHTNSHPLSTDSDFDTITTGEIAKDYLIAKNQLALHGVPSDILVFSGSTGLHDKFRQACARVYKAGILAGDNVTNYQGADPYAIKRYRIGNATSYACDFTVLKGLINSLNKYGGWMVWMMHTSGSADQWTPGTGEGSSAYIVGQAIDYAISLGIPIVTAEYGVRKYFDI